MWGYSLIPTPHALSLDYSACARPIIGLTRGLMLDFLPPTLNFFSVSAHFQFAVRFVQSARSTATVSQSLLRLTLFGKSNILCNKDKNSSKYTFSYTTYHTHYPQGESQLSLFLSFTHERKVPSGTSCNF